MFEIVPFFFFYPFSGKRWGLGFGIRFVFDLGCNRKYVWFASLWDEKLEADGQVEKKIPYF